MKKSFSIIQIFKEFIQKFPKQFSLLFILLLIEGLVSALSMLAIIPMADFLLDSKMTNASHITLFVVKIFTHLNISIYFYRLALLKNSFFFSNYNKNYNILNFLIS